MSSKRFVILNSLKSSPAVFVIIACAPALFFFLSSVCLVVVFPHCLDSQCLNVGPPDRYMCTPDTTTFSIVYCSSCDPSIDNHSDASLGLLPLSRQHLLQRLEGEGEGREGVWRGGVGGARGKRGLRGNRVLMRIPCGYSVRGLSVGSAVESEGQEQALNLAQTLTLLKQQHKSFKSCSVSSGLVLIKALLKQRHSRVKLEDNKRNSSIYCKSVKI